MDFFLKKQNSLASSAVKIQQTHHQNENCTHEQLETESGKNIWLFLGCLTQTGRCVMNWLF